MAIENNLLKRTIKQYSDALDKQFQVKSNEPSKLTQLKEVLQAFFYDKFGRVSNKYVTTGILRPKKFSFLGFRKG